MRLLQALRNQAAKVAASIEDSKLFQNMGDRGSAREYIIKDLLRPFLPECFGLSSGEVFSSDGQQSAQVDIVIFDAVFSTVLFRNGPYQLFPAESIFGSVEVKSNLTASELDRACSNVVSVKGLERAASDMLDFLPFVRFRVGSEFGWDKTRRNPYIGFVFGYKGISSELAAIQLNHRLESEPSNKQLLPDFVFVLEPGYMVARCQCDDSGNRLAGPGKDFNRYMSLDTDTDTLPLFFLTLNSCLHQLRLRSVDYPGVWSQLVNEITGRRQNSFK